MARDIFVPRRTGQFCGGHVKVLPKSSAVVAMLLLLLSDQAQGFASPPAFLKQRPCGTAPTLPARHSHENASGRSNSVPRRRPRGWVHGEERGGGEFRRCRRAATSRLWMANPEGTQQFRDRDLEFMFYDEAEVMLLYHAIPLGRGSGGYVGDSAAVATAAATADVVCRFRIAKCSVDN